MAITEIKVPDIGDFSGVDVIDVLVAEGDEITIDDSLITLETDKASMDVPAPSAGRVVALAVKLGDKVSEGSLILTLESSASATEADVAGPAEPVASSHQPSMHGASAPPSAAAPSEPPGASPTATEAAATPARQPPPAGPTVAEQPAPFGTSVHASPSIRRLARELGVDLSQVTGSGRKGRITKDDVQKFVKQTLAGGTTSGAQAVNKSTGIEPIPAIDFSQYGPIEEQPLTRIQRLSGPHLHRSWLNVPMVTQFDEADVTELEDFRRSLKAEAEKKGIRVTALAFIIRAVAKALQTYPRFNSSLSADGQNIVLKQYIHIGIAVDTANGLVVPVLRDVDNQSVFELSESMAALSKKARDGKLSPKDLQGGCFSISSLGGIGGTAFTPIVNAPEVAILGVSRTKIQPVWDGEKFVPRRMLPLALSYDHRVIDGALGARFIVYLSQLLADIRRLLL